jgi:hypothetical protein
VSGRNFKEESGRRESGRPAYVTLLSRDGAESAGRTATSRCNEALTQLCLVPRFEANHQSRALDTITTIVISRSLSHWYICEPLESLMVHRGLCDTALNDRYCTWYINRNNLAIQCETNLELF